ncbi:MAG: quinolinate synthase NadA [Candidatus Omnitrophica bacterium]|nr:quinolinate synthase NadA [Candidatus Omnitrophota bacterium]
METNTLTLQDKIISLKQEKKAVILSHNYQIPQIQDIADFVGDSLELSKKSRDADCRVIAFCGVQFMAETAKILSPMRKVLLPVKEAGCPLAEMITAKDLIELKNKHPDAWVVCYVNTTAEIKALSDVCCTSANAVTVVKNIPVKKVIFVPDKNLGWWVQRNIPEKEIISWPGFCFVHENFSLSDLELARKFYPEAEVISHPECPREVLLRSDFVLSTSGMLKRAKKSDAKRFIIATEEGLIYRLKKENPAKEFYSLGSAKICLSMKRTGLDDLYLALEKEDCQVELAPEIIKKARIALERMVQFT